MSEKQETDVSVAKLFSRFASQIEALERELKSGGISSNMSLAQRLPRHLRRRAASHNPKRVPRSVREKFSEASNEKNRKKPSRRFRRKPKNLRQVYLKRQAKIRWLPTHIWHAKRYHVIERWGWRLPHYATDKSLKSSVRSLKSESIMMDTSFMSVIELTGSKPKLVQLLNNFVPSQLGRPYSKPDFWSGCRLCSATLYDSDQSYPDGALGNVSILLPGQNKRSKNAAVTVWLTGIHPKLRDRLIEKIDKLSLKIAVKHSELSEEISTFRFFGPRTHLVLAQALGKDEKKIEHLPGAFYLSEMVEDPRPRIPIKIQPLFPLKILRKPRQVTSIAEGSSSSLFETEGRMKANSSRIPDHLVSSRKNVDNQLDNVAASSSVRIPIVISRTANFYDFFVPVQWATAFWVAFVYNGARTGGLRELENLPAELNSFAGGCSHPNTFWPDSFATKFSDAEREEAEHLARYLRRPPAKRANYRKLAIMRPFYYPWKELVSWWQKEIPTVTPVVTRDFYVFREFKTLRELSEDVNRKLHLNKEMVSQNRRALVAVELDAPSGGTPEKFGLICLPALERKSEIETEEPMHNLDEYYIPKDCNDASYTFELNSRKIMGFIVAGGFSQVTGYGRGIGFVSLLALEVLTRCRESNCIEFRSAHERKYWPAKLSILTNHKL